MIITHAHIVSSSDLEQFAWTELRRFQNVNVTKDHIARIQQLPDKQAKNVRKQATQVRYSLLQAREYYDAASSASLATSPNLLYYSVMSLVLAEILVKQDGNSSLDRARQEHRHHGLTFQVDGRIRGDEPLERSATALRATVATKSDIPFGTFELWHRSARELPIAASTKRHSENGSTASVDAVLLPADVRMSRLPSVGITLMDCFQNLPGMERFLSAHNCETNLVRGKLDVEVWQGATSREAYKIVLHPGKTGPFLSNLTFHASLWNRIDSNIFASGAAFIRWVREDSEDRFQFNCPAASMWNSSEVRFWPNATQPLNEFGYLYVGLYLAGNFARYYPDLWLAEIERATPLALGIESMLTLARTRVPLLAASELNRNYFIPEN